MIEADDAGLRMPMLPMEASMPPEDLVDQTSRAIQISPIQKFYKGTNIFITGGTGFVGKLLVEKLLRHCQEIQTIYLLVRGKKGKDMHTRIDEMFDDPIFGRLKQEYSKFRHKVVGICGDCAISGLGININDRRRLIEDVNIVFHVAATVRFDEHIRLAIAINVHATRAVIELGKQMINLKSIVHVSTAYANCHLDRIDETFYNFPINIDDLDLMISKLDDRQLQELTPKLLGDWPNTYAFTKALAESEVAQNFRGLPIGVFRPAVVVSTYKEPVVGWINNVYGPNGVVAGACKGMVRTLHCDKDIVANIVPADMCVNALICSAWDIANRPIRRVKEDVPIYNYVSSVEKPITWGEFNNLNMMYANQYPFSDIYWAINFRTNKNKIINWINVILLHFIPAFFIDVLATILGKRPQMISIYKKIQKFSDVLAPFCTTKWEFSNNNVQQLWKQLEVKDRNGFFFNMAEMDWLTYFRYYIQGMRVYLFNDPLENLEAAKLKYRRFEMLAWAFKAIFHFVMFYLIWSIMSMLMNFIF